MCRYEKSQTIQFKLRFSDVLWNCILNGTLNLKRGTLIIITKINGTREVFASIKFLQLN